MIKAILWYMIEDQELVELVDYTHQNKRINPYQPFNLNDYPYIVFEVSPFLAGDGLTQYRCDIRFCTNNVYKTESIANRLLYLFHHKKTGTIVQNTTIFSSRHAGGGSIIYYPNEKVFEQTLTFNIKSH